MTPLISLYLGPGAALPGAQVMVMHGDTVTYSTVVGSGLRPGELAATIPQSYYERLVMMARLADIITVVRFVHAVARWLGRGRS